MNFAFNNLDYNTLPYFHQTSWSLNKKIILWLLLIFLYSHSWRSWKTSMIGDGILNHVSMCSSCGKLLSYIASRYTPIIIMNRYTPLILLKMTFIMSWHVRLIGCYRFTSLANKTLIHILTVLGVIFIWLHALIA